MSDELEARLAKIKREEEIWVEESEAKAAGFMILAPNHDGSLEVDWLDASQDFQHKEAGTLLIERAVKVAKAKMMLSTLSVHTSVANSKMINFSLKNGFEVYERVSDFYGKGKDALCLKKTMSV